MADVKQLYPTHEQVRDRIKEAVMEAVRNEMTATGLGRYREFHLRGALEGIMEALSFFCVAWTKQDQLDGANDLAEDCSELIVDLVKDHVAMMLETGLRNEAQKAP